MNALLKKEIRLLLPSFGFACLLALANLLLPRDPDSVFNAVIHFTAFVFCPALAVMLALSSFGAEMSSGTFANLLTQPISRQKIWETKIKLLAGALLIVAALWLSSFVITAFWIGRTHSIDDWSDLFTILFLIGVVIFSGGLWTVLLLRQMAAAFWFTILVPGALLVLVMPLCAGESNEFSRAMVVTVLGLYSLGGFFFARWLFFRAQDLQWSGGNIEMPEMRGLARFKAAGVMRRWRPRAALWRKEIMLHQSQLVMAFVLAVLHLGVLVARHWVDKHKAPDMYFILEIFWGLWFVMPLLVGCAVVAEERKLGTLGAQLCLPVQRRTQFGIKFLVGLGLSLVLGVLMPLVFEGSRILPPIDSPIDPIRDVAACTSNWGSGFSTGAWFLWNLLTALDQALPVLLLLGIAGLIYLVSFLTSTLTRNTLQSLAPAVLGLLLTYFLMVLMVNQPYRQLYPAWQGTLMIIIAGPLLLSALVWLLFKNFQLVQSGWKNVVRNVGVLLGTLLLAGALTSAVYHRFWEKFTPLEPAHGPARLSLANPPQLTVWWGETSVRLPDGRIWTAPFVYDSRAASLLEDVNWKLGEGWFYPGSDWVSIRRYAREMVGVKTDGTLWISEAPVPIAKVHQSGWQADDQKMRNLQPFGSETNWASACPEFRWTLLVKTDGTLWRLGTNQFDTKKQTWPGLRTFEPYRLGTDADWNKVEWDYGGFDLVKTNGSIWVDVGQFNDVGKTNQRLEIEPGFTLAQLYDGNQGKFRHTTQISHGLTYKVGIREDGTFRIWADMSFKKSKNSNAYEAVWAATDLQIGSGTNWLALTGGNKKVVTLKGDGTLWLWNFGGLNPTEASSRANIAKVVPVQLGSHTDWVAISGEPGNLIALAADGSLWFWPLADAKDYYNDSSRNGKLPIRPLLDVSRKPQLIGNIFSKAE